MSLVILYSYFFNPIFLFYGIKDNQLIRHLQLPGIEYKSWSRIHKRRRVSYANDKWKLLVMRDLSTFTLRAICVVDRADI